MYQISNMSWTKISMMSLIIMKSKLMTDKNKMKIETIKSKMKTSKMKMW